MTCNLDPFTWGNCLGDLYQGLQNGLNAVSAYFQNLVLGVFDYAYGVFLGTVVNIFDAATNAIAATIIWILGGLTWIASLLGIFALPFAVIAMVAVWAALNIAWEVLKDTPIVGAFT